MKKEKKIPPCIIGEVNYCRGCPGWSFMLEAKKNKQGIWAKLPIHCPVVNLTIYNIKNQND